MFEEIIRVSQIRKRGRIQTSGDAQGYIKYLNREIEANEKLLRNKKAYALTKEDVESVQENLSKYYSDLEDAKNV